MEGYKAIEQLILFIRKIISQRRTAYVEFRDLAEFENELNDCQSSGSCTVIRCTLDTPLEKGAGAIFNVTSRLTTKTMLKVTFVVATNFDCRVSHDTCPITCY